MAQSNGDEKLREKVQDICDRVGAGLLPPTGAGAIMQLILADRKQHELELLDRLERRQVTPAEYIYPVVPMSAIKVERERLGK